MIDLPILIERCAPGVAAPTMHAIVSQESAAKPHAIGFRVWGPDGARLQLTSTPKTLHESKSWARWLLDNGYRFDAGVTQVHSIHFARFGLTVDSMFDACSNIRAGAAILQECYTRAYAADPHEQRALRRALSCYQSGNFVTGFRTGYVQQVTKRGIANAQSPLPGRTVLSQR
jgi:type IV secretion system protein VirB1